MASTPLTCLIEIPKGSRNKYELDHETNEIKLDRFLFSSVVYPADYGFIPETLGLDGDPLDVLVCVSEPTFPGCAIDVRPLGLFKMADDAGIDDKILCVPLNDPTWSHVATLDDVPEQLKNEIQHFFSIYKDLEYKEVTIDGWHGLDVALTTIEECRRRFVDEGGH